VIGTGFGTDRSGPDRTQAYWSGAVTPLQYASALRTGSLENR